MIRLSVYSKAIIGLVAVAALSTVGYVISAHKNAKEELNYTMEYGSVQLFSFDANLIKTLSIDTPDEGSYTLDYENGDWSIENEEFLPNEARVENVVSVMSVLTSTRTISFNASGEDLTIYGLDKPTGITCALTDGSSYKMYIGNPTPTGENYYAMRDGEDYIYLISSEYGVYLDCTRDALKDPYIIEYGTIYSNVNYLRLERDEDVVFEVEYGMAWQEMPMQGLLTNGTTERWSVLQPIDWVANYSDISTIIDNIIRVQVYEFVEENCQELAKYGLDEPKYRLVMRTDKGDELDISFGNQNIDGTYIYAMYEDTKQVVLFATSDLPILDSDATEVYNSVIYNSHTLVTNDNQTDIAEIDLLLDGKQHHITNNSYDDINEYTFDGIELIGDINGSALVEELYGAMVTLTFSALDTENKSVDVSGDPYMKIHYLCADGEEVNIDLYDVPGQELRYYVFLNGEYTQLIVRENVIDSATGIRVACNSLEKYVEDNY